MAIAVATQVNGSTAFPSHPAQMRRKSSPLIEAQIFFSFYTKEALFQDETMIWPLHTRQEANATYS